MSLPFRVKENRIAECTTQFESLEKCRQSHLEEYVQQRRHYKDQREKSQQMREQRSKVIEEQKLLNRALNKDHDA